MIFGQVRIFIDLKMISKIVVHIECVGVDAGVSLFTRFEGVGVAQV